MLAFFRSNLDRLGACASAICAVHCVLTGLAFGLLSVSGLAFLDNEVWDLTFVGFALVLGLWAVWHGLQKHHSILPALVFGVGIACIIAGNFVVKHTHHSGVPEAFWDHYSHTVLMVVGGLSLVGFHTANLWLQKHGGCGCEGCKSMQP